MLTFAHRDAGAHPPTHKRRQAVCREFFLLKNINHIKHCLRIRVLEINGTKLSLVNQHCRLKET